MHGFTLQYARGAEPLRWVVAAPGESPVEWEQIVSEDEDGTLSGWAREAPAPAAIPARRCA